MQKKQIRKTLKIAAGSPSELFRRPMDATESSSRDPWMQHRHVGCWEETNWVIMSTDAQAVQETLKSTHETLNRRRNAGKKPCPRMELFFCSHA